MESLYTKFVSTILFPAQELLKGHVTVNVLKEMERSQWWPPEQLQALQLLRLKKLLSHAAERVPYYRQLFSDMGYAPQDLKTITDLQRLPFLNKDIIRANLDLLKSEDARGLSRFNTGGSSGEPLIFYIGRERVSHDVAAKWRATRWWGVDIGDPEIVVWGSPIEVHAQDYLRASRDAIFRTKLLPAFRMSDDKLMEFISQIRAMRPKMLFGYPSALAYIAKHAELESIRMDDLGIKVAFVTSEQLYEHQRQQIAKIFACQVANGYGGRDAGFIAHQCPSGGLHITAEDIIVELVDNNGNTVRPGAAGEVVVTHLATRDYPFIRYRTGDVAIMDDKACSCGRGLPLLKEIQGRTTDFVIAQDGTVMHGLALIYILRDLPGLNAFKIIQETTSLVRVLIVPGAEMDANAVPSIISGIKSRLGNDVQVVVEKVDEIPLEKSGKFRYVVSNVKV